MHPHRALFEVEPMETLTTFLGSDADVPVGAEEMEELRSMARHDASIAAALRMAERGGLDVDTILEIRNAAGG